MGILYNKLFSAVEFSALSVNDYLPNLIEEVVANFPDGGIVKVEKYIEEFVLDARRLQPLGIIINELLTNTMKYAFKGRETGLITVSASNSDGHIAVSVQDNGCGIPETVSFETDSSFGLQLVQTLKEQLEGSISIERGNGSRVILEFEQ